MIVVKKGLCVLITGTRTQWDKMELEGDIGAVVYIVISPSMKDVLYFSFWLDGHISCID